MGKDKLSSENPGAWGTGGSYVNARICIDDLYDVVKTMKEQFNKGNLEPELAKKHVERIKQQFKLLEQHVDDPTKYN